MIINGVYCLIDMEIIFATKEENNRRREAEFLEMAPEERLKAFIRMVSSPPPIPEYDKYKYLGEDKRFEIRKKMDNKLDREVYDFIKACNEYDVKMLLIGAVAVNYYGYKRYSDNIDFWIDNSRDNLSNLLEALKKLNYAIDDFPDKVKNGEQNISIKLSPNLEMELIVNFDPGKPFRDAFADSVEFFTGGDEKYKWNIISYDDLVNSKIKSGRPRDWNDVQEYKRLRKRKD